MKLKLAVFLVSLLTLGSFVYWLLGFTYLQITVVGESAPGKAEYKIINQGGGKEQVVFSETGSVKKLVRRGGYQVEVKQNGLSYVGVVSAGGFLKTNSIESRLSGEKTRDFIGNGPKTCVDWSGNLLTSWQCQSTTETVLSHLPADDKTPSTNKPFSGSATAKVEAIISDNGVRYLFVKNDDVHGYYELGASNQLISSSLHVLSGLSSSKNYGAVNYKTGILVFSHSGDELLYYESFGGPPVRLPDARIKTKGLGFYSASAQREAVLLVYNQHSVPEYTGEAQISAGSVFSRAVSEETDEDVRHEEKILNASEFVIIEGNEPKYFKLDKAVISARLCGINKLCAVYDSKMGVYEMDGKKLKKLYELSDIDQIESSAAGLLVVNKTGVMVFDVDGRNGFYEYSFGGYGFCGIKPFGEQYFLCVRQGEQKRALLIKQGQFTNDYIDRQVFGLAQIPEVKALSPYGRFIHLSPNLGELTINPVTGEFEFSQSVIDTANQKIKEALVGLGVDLNKYKIINPFD